MGEGARRADEGLLTAQFLRLTNKILAKAVMGTWFSAKTIAALSLTPHVVKRVAVDAG